MKTYSLNTEQAQALAKLSSSRPSSSYSAPSFVRDLAVRGYSVGCTDQQILVFARKQVATRVGLAKFLKQITPVKRVLATALRTSLVSSPAGARANSQTTSRLLAGRLLSKFPEGTPRGIQGEEDLDDATWAEALLATPVAEAKPLSPARQLRARTALAVVGMELLASINSELGYNTIQLPYSRLALTAGWSQTTAKAGLNDLVQHRLISELSTGRKAAARRFKLNRGLSPDQKAVAENQFETIGTLMGREGAASPAADMIKLVGHSAWNYGTKPLGHRAWIVAVADASGIDPLTLSVSKRNIAIDRKTLIAAGISADMTAEDLTAALDVFSRESGGLVAKRAAEEAHRLASAERVADIEYFSGLKVTAKEIVATLAGTFESIPKAGVAGGRKLARWIETSRAAFADREYPVDLATAVTNEVGRVVGGRIRDAAAGEIVGGWITAGLDVDGDLPAKRVLAKTAARGLDLYAPLMSIPGAKSEEIDQRRFLKELREQLNATPPMSTAMQAAITADLRARLTVRLWPADKAVKGSVWAVRDVSIIPTAAATQAA